MTTLHGADKMTSTAHHSQ